MTEASRTVRVSGLPTDIEEERLLDKLTVYFLRSRNGGGEIEAITVDETKPYCAMVQFEDSGVAQRVIQLGQHTLKVDGKEYMLSVSDYCQILDPNKVIINLTATVDYSQIPEGRSALTRLLGDRPDIETSYDSTKLCRLRGAYTEVQSVLTQLLGPHPEDPKSQELSGSGRPSVSRSEFPIKTPSEKVDERDLTGGVPTAEEDLSLMVDADVFKYLQKRYGHEFQRLQSQHGVEVVDVTNQGITTLFLQVITGEGDKERERIELARAAISELYQESERRICQAELRKSDLDPSGDLQQAMETLRVRFPKLLLSENDSCVFLIGDRSKVSEAKQFLLQEHRVMEREDVASLLGIPFSHQTAAEERDTLAVSQSVSRTLDVGKDRVQQSEGGKMYHLAARFKESGPPLRTHPGDFSFGGTSNPSRHSTHELRSEAAGDSSGVLRPLMRSKTSSDIPAKSGRSFRNTTPIPPPGKVHTGSMAKRTNSFSGQTQQRLQKTEDNPPASPLRAGTSSLSKQRQKDQHGIYHAEVLVSTIMWHHIKEIYSTQLEALTGDMQLNEGGSQGRIQSVIGISGSEQSAVTACQLALQELVDTVSADICVHELHLSELGVSDVEDETLQACCAEVRRRFPKITVQVMRTSLYLIGPKRLCYQVAASLRGVFSGETDTQKDPTSPSIGRQVIEGASQMSSETQPNSASQQRILNHKEDHPKTELLNGANSQVPSRRDSNIKEKLEKASVLDRRKTSVHRSKANPADVNGVWSATPQNDKATQSHQKEPQPGGICVCGEAGTSMNRTDCGVVMCSKCLDAVHIHCRVCHSGPPQHPAPVGIQGMMNHCKLNFSLPGHNKHATIKVTYLVPDGIQKDHHPSPGKPFQGGVFEAFLPDCDKSRNLLPKLEEAFRQGLTFTVTSKEKGSRVTWDAIPHKTGLQGGRSGNGYPDSSYLERLSDVLTAHGIKGQTSTS